MNIEKCLEGYYYKCTLVASLCNLTLCWYCNHVQYKKIGIVRFPTSVQLSTVNIIHINEYQLINLPVLDTVRDGS